MAKKIRFQDVFQPGDILALLIVIIGVLIAIFLDGLAVKLIGVSIAVLGGLALVLMISQRLSEIVESNKFNIPETKNLKVTVVIDSTAKRQTVENFDPSIDIEKIEQTNTMGADEGFRIVSKSSRNLQNKLDTQQTTSSISEVITINETNENVDKTENQEKFSFQEERQVTEISSQESSQIVIETINEKDTTTSIETAAETHSTEPEIIISEISTPEEVISNEVTIEQEQKTIEKELEDSESIEPTNVEEELIDEKDFDDIKEIENHQSKEETFAKESDLENELLLKEIEKFEYLETEQSETELNAENNSTDLKQPKSDFIQKQVDIPQFLFDDEDYIVDEPRKEFDGLLSRILYVIPLVIKSRTTAFTFINPEKNYLILESYVTNIPDNIVNDTKIPMGHDILSQIYQNAKPEILTEINPSAELDLIPYYNDKTGTSSFVGIPVFYNNEVIGILSCDTSDNDAYDANTITFLGQFSKLISGLIKNYTEKYDLLRASKTLTAINKFSEISSNAGSNLEIISKALFDTISKIFDNYSFGICLYDDKREGFYIFDYSTKYEFPISFRNEPIELTKTLLGNSILNYCTIVEIPVKSNQARVSIKEYPFTEAFFISVPIKTETTVYGAIFFDGPMSDMDNYDLEILETLAREAGHSIDRFKLIQLFQTSAIIDPNNGLMNNYAFFRRLQEEVARVRDYKSTVSFCLISIDKYAAYTNDDDNKFEHIFHHIVSLLNKSVNEYDVIGRLDVSVLGVILIGQSVDKAKFWAENIRNKAAISVLEIDGRRFTVTLSIGIAQISPADDLDSLLENCNRVLNIAASKTNCVQVYH